jgi:hypothetical protein
VDWPGKIEKLELLSKEKSQFWGQLWVMVGEKEFYEENL